MDHETIGGILVILFGGWGIKKALAAGRAEQDKQDSVWSTAATRVRGEVIIDRGSWFRSPKRRIDLRTGDTPIVVETIETSHVGGGKVRSTRVTAGPLEGLGDLEMRVVPRSAIALGRVSKALRFDEVATRNEEFDKRIRVHGDPPALVREMLDARLCRRILDLEEGFVIDAASIVVEREGIPEEASTITAMVSFIEAIASRWEAMVEAPRRLGDALGLERVEAERGVVARGLRRGRAVTLGVRVGSETIETVLSFDARAGGREEIVREGLAVDADEIARRLDAALEKDGAASAYR